MVVDTSILLAVLFGKEQARWAAGKLNEHASHLVMSTVNLAEALIRIKDRLPSSFAAIEAMILNSGIRFIPPDIEQARIAAEARLRYPLNLGDCFAYALAVKEGCPILTLDRDFRITDCVVVHP